MCLGQLLAIILQVKPDVKVTASVPSLAIEEVTPSFQSDASNLLGSQVKNKSLYIGQSEKTKTDKLRERRKRKKRTKAVIKSKVSRQKLVLSAAGNTNTSEKAGFKSSVSFFAHLQEKVATSIKLKKYTNKKHNHTKYSSLFKL